MYNSKYIKYKTKYLNLSNNSLPKDTQVGGMATSIQKIGNITLNLCTSNNKKEGCAKPDKSGQPGHPNHGDIFKQLEHLRDWRIKDSKTSKPKAAENINKIYVIVPGNAGQPGGKHGYVLYDDTQFEQNYKTYKNMILSLSQDSTITICTQEYLKEIIYDSIVGNDTSGNSRFKLRDLHTLPMP